MNKAEAVKKAIDMFEPEAKEVIALAKNDRSTKDGYGKVLQVISGFPKDMQTVFLLALIKNGYPKGTAMQIADIQGLN